MSIYRTNADFLTSLPQSLANHIFSYLPPAVEEVHCYFGFDPEGKCLEQMGRWLERSMGAFCELRCTNKEMREMVQEYARKHPLPPPLLADRGEVIRDIVLQEPALQPQFTAWMERAGADETLEEVFAYKIGEFYGSRFFYWILSKADKWKNGPPPSLAERALLTAFVERSEAGVTDIIMDKRHSAGVAACLSRGLGANRSIVRIAITHAQLRSEDAVLLSTALLVNQSVVHLDLSNPNVAAPWFTRLPPDSQMAVRCMQFNQIDDVAARALVLAVKDKKRFILDLRGNLISDLCRRELAQMMPAHRPLLFVKKETNTTFERLYFFKQLPNV